MKSGRTLVELATELDRQSKSKKDYIADTRRLSLQATADKENPIIMNGVIPRRSGCEQLRGLSGRSPAAALLRSGN